MKYLSIIFYVTSISMIWMQSISCNLCSCNHCDNDTAVISIVVTEDDNENDSSIENFLYKEDFDGDGSRIICARDRDHEDRSFPSICHMLCYNACTEFNTKENNEKNGTYDVIAYRTNYYKLHDGPCQRHYS
ncbi:uncharacterized protein [Chelonus insularis]|uniref:uncharacterized protein n=1 Tax=Chelonus insularis TaxID=460826 RepID=UPI00158E05B5|nr:uncharacterized protein LOC118073826 [Chelonus insularis]